MLSKESSNAWARVPRGYLRHTGGGIGVTAGDMYVQYARLGSPSVFGH